MKALALIGGSSVRDGDLGDYGVLVEMVETKAKYAVNCARAYFAEIIPTLVKWALEKRALAVAAPAAAWGASGSRPHRIVAALPAGSSSCEPGVGAATNSKATAPASMAADSTSNGTGLVNVESLGMSSAGQLDSAHDSDGEGTASMDKVAPVQMMKGAGAAIAIISNNGTEAGDSADAARKRPRIESAPTGNEEQMADDSSYSNDEKGCEEALDYNEGAGARRSTRERRAPDVTYKPEWAHKDAGATNSTHRAARPATGADASMGLGKSLIETASSATSKYGQTIGLLPAVMRYQILAGLAPLYQQLQQPCTPGGTCLHPPHGPSCVAKQRVADVDGYGLFVVIERNVDVGTCMAVYGGTVETLEDHKNRYSDDVLAPWSLPVCSGRYYIDASTSPGGELELAHWANDYRGLGAAPNAELTDDGRLVATAIIRCGEQVLVDYGVAYWQGYKDQHGKLPFDEALL